MRFLRSLVLFVILLLVLVVGLDYTLSGVGELQEHPVLEPFLGLLPVLYTDEHTTQWRLFWAGVAFLPVLYWLIGLFIWQQRPTAFRVQSGSGEVMLLESGALIKFARMQVESHPAVVWHKVKLRQTGNKALSVIVRVRVRPIQSLPEIRAGLENSIRRGFAQVMGVENIDEVRIIMGFDEQSLNQRPGVTTPAEEAPEPPQRSQLAREAAAATAATTVALPVQREGEPEEIVLRRPAGDAAEETAGVATEVATESLDMSGPGNGGAHAAPAETPQAEAESIAEPAAEPAVEPVESAPAEGAAPVTRSAEALEAAWATEPAGSADEASEPDVVTPRSTGDDTADDAIDEIIRFDTGADPVTPIGGAVWHVPDADAARPASDTASEDEASSPDSSTQEERPN